MFLSAPRLLLAAALAAALVLAAPSRPWAQPLRLIAGAPPVAAWTEEMGGGRVAVQSITPRAAAPSRYAPTETRARGLSGARALLLAGLPEEDIWLARLRRLNPKLAAVDLRGGLPPADFPPDRRLAVLSPCGAARPFAPAPFVWTAPTMAAVMLSNIRGALTSLDPEGARTFRRNYEGMARRLQDVSRKLEKAVQAAAPRREFLAARPGLGWLAADLGLDMLLVHADDDSRLASWELRCIVDYAAANRFPMLFIRPGRHAADAQAVAAAVGAQLVSVDPLSPRWLDMLERLSRILPAALR